MEDNKQCFGLNPPVEFVNVQSTRPVPSLWDKIIGRYQGEELKQQTLSYRALKKMGDDDTAQAIKKKMPVFLTSAICSNGRKNSDIIGFTGVLMADFDHVPPAQMQQVLCTLRQDIHVFMVATTISGEGVRVLVRVDGLSVNNFMSSFLAVNHYCSQLVGGLEFDEQCKNLNRVSIINYDPDVYYNPQAVPFVVPDNGEGVLVGGDPLPPLPPDMAASIAAEKAASLAAEKVAVNNAKNADNGRDEADGKKQTNTKKRPTTYFKDMTRNATILARRDGFRAQPRRYNAFINDCVFRLATWGAKKEEVLVWVLGRFSRHDAKNSASVVDSVYAKKPLKVEMPNIRVELEDIQDWISERFQYRHNVLKSMLEFAAYNGKDWQNVNDKHEHELWRQMMFEGIRTSVADIHTLLYSDFAPMYNPLTAYLQSLKPWDGKTDYLGELANRVKVDMHQELFARCLSKWIVSLVACGLDPRVANEIFLIILGEQGICKTTFFEYILPPCLREFFQSKVNTDSYGKDDVVRLAQLLVTNFEELDTFSPSNMNRVKMLLSLKGDVVRKAYGRNMEYIVRITSYCGTGNERQLLDVLTDGRRMVTFWAQSIVDPRLKPLNYEGIYSQAYALYQSGYTYWLDKDDLKELKEHNRDFMTPNIERELIDTYFRVPAVSEEELAFGAGECHWVTTAQIIERLSISKVNIHPIRIGMAMKQLGFLCRRGRSGKMYWVADRSLSEIRSLKPLDGDEDQGV